MAAVTMPEVMVMERRLRVVATVINAAVVAGATRHVAAAITATAMRVALEQEPSEDNGEMQADSTRSARRPLPTRR